MQGSLFMVAAVENPSKKDVDENEAMSKIIMQPTCILARDDKDAAIKAVLGCDALKNANQDRLEVLIRPF